MFWLVWGGMWGALAQAGESTWMFGVKPGDRAHFMQELEKQGVKPGACFERPSVCLGEFPGERLPQGVGTLRGLRWVERDSRLAPAASPGLLASEDCGTLWELVELRVEEAWAIAGHQGELSPLIAVQDSGFLMSHVDLAGRVPLGWDYGDGDADPGVAWGSAVPGHGTFIAGLLVGREDVAAGRVGVLPEGAVDAQKIADSTGAIYTSYAVAAMADLAGFDYGVGVLSYSLASSSPSVALDEAVDALGEVGIVVVVAAGNCATEDCWDADNDEYPLYPSSHPGAHVLSVAGTLPGGELNPYSHYGRETVDLAAPGVDLCSLGVADEAAVVVESGTSYATPLVAGVVGLIGGVHPELRADELVRLVRASVRPEVDLADRVATGGVVDPVRALSVPLLRMAPPAVEGTEPGSLEVVLSVENQGPEGEAIILVFHEPDEGTTGTLSVEMPGFGAEPVVAGSSLMLEGGAVTVSAAGTLLRGPVVVGDQELRLRLVAAAGWQGELYLRALGVGPEGQVFGLEPAGAGETAPDATGQLAHHLVVEIARTGDGGGEGEGGGGDGTDETGGEGTPQVEGDTGGEVAADAEEAKENTGCGLGFPLIGLLVGLGIRRRL
jgi:subtilisin family serine protease